MRAYVQELCTFDAAEGPKTFAGAEVRAVRCNDAIAMRRNLAAHAIVLHVLHMLLLCSVHHRGIMRRACRWRC